MDSEGRIQKEGYFIFCAVKESEDKILLHYLESIGIYNDIPSTPSFAEYEFDGFSINKVVTFDSRREANFIIKQVQEAFPNAICMIGLRVRHNISKQFYPVWREYHRYLWAYKLIRWLEYKTARTRVIKSSEVNE